MREDLPGYRHLGVTALVVVALMCCCATVSADVEWTTETVQSTNDVGMYNSLAYLPDGDAVVSYFDDSNDNLRYGLRHGGVWSRATVDSAGRVGMYPSIAATSAGVPCIAYMNDTSDVGLDTALKYAWKDALGWHRETVPLTIDRGGWQPSLALDGLDRPHVSHANLVTTYELWYSWRDTDGDWTTEPVDDGASSVGRFSSIAIDEASGLPRISYLDDSNLALKYAWKDADGDWNLETVDDPTGGAGYDTSLALDSAGYPHISYTTVSYPSRLKHAWKDADGWHTEYVGTDTVVSFTSIAIDSYDNLHISYKSFTDLRHAWKYVAASIDTWEFTTVADDAAYGDTSIAIDPDNYPGISYFADGDDVRYAWLSGNRRPFARPDDYILYQDTTLTVAAPGVLENDFDLYGDELTVIFNTNPSHGTVEVNENGSFTYTPAAGYTGSDGFYYRASDGSYVTTMCSVTLHVLANHKPVAWNDYYSTLRGTVLKVDDPGVLANDTDADGDPLSARMLISPAHGMILFKIDGSFLYTPDTGYTGSDSFIYVANDGHVDSDVAVVYIKVKPTLVSLPGLTKKPTDPDHDGIYEDLNGNDRLDFADVVLYFQQIQWIKDNEPVEAFDVNGNGRIDFADIVALFREV